MVSSRPQPPSRVGQSRRVLFERTRYLVAMLWSYITFPTVRPKNILFCASSPVNKITVRRGGREDKVTMSQWVRESCPSLSGVFRPSWFLWNGHLQTIYSVIGNFSLIDHIMYRRTLIRLPDGGTVGLDFVHNPSNITDDTTPILVMLHGLTGGSHESYVRNVMVSATKSKEEGGLGMRGVVVNFRGCADVPLTSPQLYSAGHTEDIRSACLYISRTYPNAPLVGIGFSLGAGVLARFVAEEGEMCVLRAAIVVGAPWDCVAMSDALEATWFNRNAYSKAMGGNILKIFRKLSAHEASPLRQPESRSYKNLAKIAAMKRPLLRAIDELVVCEIGGCSPPFPFKSAADYYAWASPQNKISGIKIPTLCISAMDDPIIAGDLLPVEEFSKSSHAQLVIVGGGGHLGWFEGGIPFLKGPQRWLHRPVREFLTAALEQLVLDDSIERKVEESAVVGAEEIEVGEPFRWILQKRVPV